MFSYVYLELNVFTYGFKQDQINLLFASGVSLYGKTHGSIQPERLHFLPTETVTWT